MVLKLNVGGVFRVEANEFLRYNGIVKCSRIVEDLSEQGVDSDFTKDLKRLVESHELIEQYNGLFEAKELIRVSPKLTSELRGLAAAIADVESCK